MIKLDFEKKCLKIIDTFRILYCSSEYHDGLNVELRYCFHHPRLAEKAIAFRTAIEQVAKDKPRAESNQFEVTAIFPYVDKMEKIPYNAATWRFMASEAEGEQAHRLGEIREAVEQGLLPILSKYSGLSDSLEYILELPVSITNFGQYIIPFGLLELDEERDAALWVQRFRKPHLRNNPYQLFADRFLDDNNLRKWLDQ